MAIRDKIRGWLMKGVTEAPASGGGGSAKRDPLTTIIKKLGLALGVDSSSRDFLPPEFDLTQVTTAYDTEAYVRQAIDKYIELMFKAGWDVVGKNQNAVDYIRLRLKLISEMTQIPTDQLFIEIAEDLVKYSNVVLVKARDAQNLIAATKTGIKVIGLGGVPAIAGYFPLNVTTMALRRDKNGVVKGWQQEVEGQDKPVKFKPEDIVHIYYKRDKGNAFGKPFLMPVLDDIRALRQMEETVLRLVYRNLNPLLHIQVGDDNIPGQQSEVDSVQVQFENMDLEAGFATTNRVKLVSVASDKIIDANEYMKHFEQRVFTGLGVSELMMGRGNTANRSTGDNLSNEFTDRVKAYQKVMAIFVDEFIIKELLMEGGFDPLLNPDDDVDFTFKEIDVDAKIKAENHAIFQYEHNAISEDEMRILLGRDPITDRATMFMNLVTIPIAAATAAVKAEASPTAGTPATNNKNKPANQNGTKPSPKKTAASVTPFQELYLRDMEHTFESSHEAVIKLIDSYVTKRDPQRLLEMKSVIRSTEESFFGSMQHYLGIDYAKDFKVQVHRTCERLYTEIVDITTTMNGSQRSERLYETVAGIYQIMQLRIMDVAEHAYKSYIADKEVE